MYTYNTYVIQLELKLISNRSGAIMFKDILQLLGHIAICETI